MNTSTLLSRQGHRLLQIGIALFVFSGLEGFAIPALPVPRLGPVRSYVERLAGRHAAGPGASVAQTQARR